MSIFWKLALFCTLHVTINCYPTTLSKPYYCILSKHFRVLSKNPKSLAHTHTHRRGEIKSKDFFLLCVKMAAYQCCSALWEVRCLIFVQIRRVERHLPTSEQVNCAVRRGNDQISMTEIRSKAKCPPFQRPLPHKITSLDLFPARRMRKSRSLSILSVCHILPMFR